MASFSYQDYQEYQKENPFKSNYSKNRVGFFDLKKDGEEAIVRFDYASPKDFTLFTVHHVQVKGKWRNIDCLNTPYTTDKCPLCEANKANRRFFIKLIQYVKKEDGSIEIQPKIWERSDAYANTLNNLFNEYGDISKCIFKIRRNGNKGDVRTSYDIMYASPVVYKPEIYPEDFSSFDNFKFSDFFVLSKTAEEMKEILNPSDEDPQAQTQPQPTQPIQQPKNEFNSTLPPQQPQTNPYANNTPRRTYEF